MSVIDTRTNEVVGKVTGFFGPYDIVVTKKQALISNFGNTNFYPYGTTVSIVDLHSLKIIKNIFIGIQPAGLALTPHKRFCYVTCYNTLYVGTEYTDLTAYQGLVSVINIKRQKVVNTFAVGLSPTNIAISSNGKLSVTTNFTSNTITIKQL